MLSIAAVLMILQWRDIELRRACCLAGKEKVRRRLRFLVCAHSTSSFVFFPRFGGNTLSTSINRATSAETCPSSVSAVRSFPSTTQRTYRRDAIRLNSLMGACALFQPWSLTNRHRDRQTNASEALFMYV